MFEWDQNKNIINIEKHGIDFETAKLIFSYCVITSRCESNYYEEVRYISIGQI